MGKPLDLTGQRFGKLIVDELAGSINRQRYWYCTCDCGIETIARVGNLRDGSHISCGHCDKHDYIGTPTYNAWRNLVCREGRPDIWNDFMTFLRDVGERPSKSYQLTKRDYTQPHGPNNTYWRNDHAKRRNSYIEPPCLNLRGIIRAEIAARKGEEAARRVPRTQTA